MEKKYTVLCKVVSWGKAYGTKGGTITLPEEIGDPLTTGSAPKLKLGAPDKPEKAAK